MSGGFDRRLAPGRFLGGAVSQSDSLLTYRNQSAGDNADITSTQVSLYGTQNIGRVFIEGTAAYGWQEYDSTRNTGVSGVAAGSFNGHLWGFRAGGGMPIALSSHASITPQARLDWNTVKQDAYKETGGGPLALSVASRSADTFRSSLGGQIDFATRVGDFMGRPFFRAFWNHNFSNDGLNASANFVSGGSAFITPGQKLESNPYTLGAGINFFTQGAFTAALAYDGNFAKSYQSHVYQAKVRWAF
jgi:outer membrane autotransporter protein